MATNRISANDPDRSFLYNERRIYGLSDFINRTSRVERTEVVWHQLKDFAAKLGMRDLLVLATARLGRKLEPAVLYADSPRKVLKALDREWPPARNPVLRYTEAVLKPFSMSEAHREFAFFGFDWRKFASASVREGDALVVPIADGELDGIAVFAGRHPDVSPFARSLIQVAAQFAFQRVRAIDTSGKPKSRPARTLSKRERECLRLAATGKTDSEIAEALGISSRTVRFHFANAKARLGARNRNETIALVASARA